MCSGLITVLLMSRGAHPGKKRSPSSAPGPGSSAPSHLHVQAEQIWVWKRRASWLNTETVSLISFSKMKASGDFTLSQNVCLSWQLEPCGRGKLQAACTASPQGRSPCSPTLYVVYVSFIYLLSVSASGYNDRLVNTTEITKPTNLVLCRKSLPTLGLKE